jgi:Family of unknown function (DUF5521)
LCFLPPEFSSVRRNIKVKTQIPEGNLIGRVTQKSRLLCHTKPNDIKYPIHFSLEIEDESDSIRVVVWNSACRDYFHSVHVGDVILVQNYRLKVYSQQLHSNELPLLRIEAAVNASHPEGLIYTLTCMPPCAHPCFVCALAVRCALVTSVFFGDISPVFTDCVVVIVMVVVFSSSSSSSSSSFFLFSSSGGVDVG